MTTAGLARMNMILHDFPTANILSGNTLASPKFKDGEQLRTYDYVVANPPFSDKTWSTGLTSSNDPFQRFAWGEPPAKQGDYAYLLHIVRSMKSKGKAACILPHGVLFRGNAEAVIRTQLVRSGILKGIIGLPANLFYGTGIPACILVSRAPRQDPRPQAGHDAGTADREDPAGMTDAPAAQALGQLCSRLLRNCCGRSGCRAARLTARVRPAYPTSHPTSQPTSHPTSRRTRCASPQPPVRTTGPSTLTRSASGRYHRAQHTRQASVRKVTLTSAGFLFPDKILVQELPPRPRYEGIAAH